MTKTTCFWVRQRSLSKKTHLWRCMDCGAAAKTPFTAKPAPPTACAQIDWIKEMTQKL